MPISPADLLQTMTATAVLGTGRQPAPPVAPEGDIGALCAALPAANAESRFLRTAAILATVRLAGARPPCGAPGVIEASAESQAGGGDVRAASQLRRVLESGHWQVLADWSNAAHRLGHGVPSEVMPALLAKLSAKSHEPEVPRMLEVLGERGRWLSAQNPAWSRLYAGFDELLAAWDLASGAARTRLLTSMRRLDAERAREVLAGALADEDADARAELIAALPTGLSMADEPFLEAALGDASKVVRRAAADVLAALPESRLCARMAGRTRELVSLAPGGGRKRRAALVVTLPGSSKELAQDGVEDRKLGPLGNKAWMLAQMVGATPLGVWPTIAALEPRGWIEAAHDTDWRPALVLGWTIAAGRQGDPAWAAALLECLLAEAPGEVIELTGERVRPLVCALSQAKREALLAEAMAAHASDLTQSLAWRALFDAAPPWSARFARTVLTALATYLGTLKDGWDTSLRAEHAAALAVRADIGIAAEIAAQLAVRQDRAPSTQRWIDEFVGLVQLRSEYLSPPSRKESAT